MTNVTPGTTPLEHSNTVGGSTAGRVLKCPGSYELSKSMPQGDNSSPYAAEGTGLHNAIEWCLEAQANGDDADEVIGMTFPAGTGQTLKITKDLWNECLEPSLEAYDEVVGSSHLDRLIEVTSTFPGIPRAFGTADIVYRRVLGDGSVVAGILDWKFGRGVSVEADGNSQLYFYLWSCLNDPKTADMFSDVTTFEVVIVQPRLRGNRADVAEVHIDDLRIWASELVAAYKEATGPQPGFVEGPHCKFCKGKPKCALKTGAVRQALLLDPNDLKNLSEAMHLVRRIEDWARDVEKLAHQQMEEGQIVEGFKLVQKRATRQWVDEEITEAWMRKHGVKVGTMMVPKKLRSVTQLEKALKGSKYSIPESQIQKVSSGTTIATADDKRPAVDRSMAGLADAVKAAQG